MKGKTTVIALILVSMGAGVDAEDTSYLAVAMSLCLFFGSVMLARPAISMLSLAAAKYMPVKATPKRARR